LTKWDVCIRNRVFEFGSQDEALQSFNWTVIFAGHSYFMNPFSILKLCTPSDLLRFCLRQSSWRKYRSNCDFLLVSRRHCVFASVLGTNPYVTAPCPQYGCIPSDRKQAILEEHSSRQNWSLAVSLTHQGKRYLLASTRARKLRQIPDPHFH
jgi:hypothetical protein